MHLFQVSNFGLISEFFSFKFGHFNIDNRPIDNREKVHALITKTRILVIRPRFLTRVARLMQGQLTDSTVLLHVPIISEIFTQLDRDNLHG